MRKDTMQEVAQLSQFDEELYKVSYGMNTNTAIAMDSDKTVGAMSTLAECTATVNVSE